MRLAALVLSALIAAQPAPYDALLAKLDAYLADYEPRLSELIADEFMSQEIETRKPLPENQAFMERYRERRRLNSEVAFVALPQGSGWLGFRQVKSVDQKPVIEGESLTALLSASGFDRARILIETSAAHNLGLPRTTNLPNLPLEFLHRRNRHRLVARLDGRERMLGVSAVRVVLHEKVTPTLIVSPSGGDMPSTIRAWIDPGNGRLLRATVTTFTYPSAPKAENSVEVVFEEEKALGLMVPKEMHETFPGGPGTGKSSAVYSNYRRFQTSARIVPQ